MRAPLSVLLFTLALAMPAVAQPAAPMDSASCATGIAALQQSMDTARAKGQMLRRRQLAEELDALQTRCAPHAQDPQRAADTLQVEQLEQEIRELRTRLEQAQEQLRKLKGEGG